MHLAHSLLSYARPRAMGWLTSLTFALVWNGCDRGAHAETDAKLRTNFLTEWYDAQARHQLHLAEPTHESGRICLVTHYTENMASYARTAAKSHALYARLHGHLAKAYVGRLSGSQYLEPSLGDEDHLFGGGLFWQKFVAVDMALKEGVADADGQMNTCDWVLWFDSDIVITNYNVDLATLMAGVTLQAGPTGFGVDVILSAETDHPISAGAFFVRRSSRGQAFVDAVRALYPLYKGNNLPEQTAMATVAFMLEPWPSDTAARGITPHLHPNIAVAPQRSFNSFMGVGRTFSPEMQWQPGDFVAHFAGTPRHLREAAMQDLFDSTRPR